MVRILDVGETDPTDPDTDDGTVDDGTEVEDGTDPHDGEDHEDHGGGSAGGVKFDRFQLKGSYQSGTATVDAALTTGIGDQVKVMAWYDNEMGYSQRLFDLAAFVAARL